MNIEEEYETENGQNGLGKFFTLFAAGFALVFIGVVFVMVASLLGNGEGSASAGVVVFIGPFPIAFGAGPDAGWLILVGVVLAVVSVVLFAVLRRRVWG